MRKGSGIQRGRSKSPSGHRDMLPQTAGGGLGRVDSDAGPPPEQCLARPYGSGFGLSVRSHRR